MEVLFSSRGFPITQHFFHFCMEIVDATTKTTSVSLPSSFRVRPSASCKTTETTSRHCTLRSNNAHSLLSTDIIVSSRPSRATTQTSKEYSFTIKLSKLKFPTMFHCHPISLLCLWDGTCL